MTTYALNTNNDIYLDKGTIATVFDDDQIVQDIKTRLQTFQGEFFVNLLFGVPYFQVIFQKPANIGVFDTLIRTMILGTNGVQSIVNYQSSIDSIQRKYIVNFSVKAISGNNLQMTTTFQ